MLMHELVSLEADELRGPRARRLGEQLFAAGGAALLESGIMAVPNLVERYDAVKFGIFQRNLSNFRGLVLFCIEADFCNQILIF